MSSTLAMDVRTVAKKKSEPEPRDRIDLRVAPEWYTRVKRQADRLGLSVAAYIRQATTRQVETDEESDPQE